MREALSPSVITKGEEGVERNGEGEAVDRCDEIYQHVGNRPPKNKGLGMNVK